MAWPGVGKKDYLILSHNFRAYRVWFLQTLAPKTNLTKLYEDLEQLWQKEPEKGRENPRKKRRKSDRKKKKERKKRERQNVNKQSLESLMRKTPHGKIRFSILSWLSRSANVPCQLFTSRLFHFSKLFIFKFVICPNPCHRLWGNYLGS